MRLTLSIINRKLKKDFLYILQISLCLFLIITLIISIYNYYIFEGNDLKNNIKNCTLIIDTKDIISIDKNIYKVAQVNYLLEDFATLSNNKNVLGNIEIIDNKYNNIEMIYGNYIQKSNDILITKPVYEQIKDNTISIVINNKKYDFFVAGVINDQRRYIILNHIFLEELIKNKKINLRGYKIISKDYKTTNKILKKMLKKGFNVYRDSSAQIEEIKSLQNMINTFVFISCIFIFFITLLFLFNVKKMFLEQKNNIVILKSLGVKSRNVANIYLHLYNSYLLLSIIISTIITILLKLLFDWKITVEILLSIGIICVLYFIIMNFYIFKNIKKIL